MVGGCARVTDEAKVGSARTAGRSGDDRIDDDDRITGDRGTAGINVVAGGLDIVTCGPGNDTVFVGVGDVVSVDCEDVRR